jgi:hypothetical protein
VVWLTASLRDLVITGVDRVPIDGGALTCTVIRGERGLNAPANSPARGPRKRPAAVRVLRLVRRAELLRVQERD